MRSLGATLDVDYYTCLVFLYVYIVFPASLRTVRDQRLVSLTVVASILLSAFHEGAYFVFTISC